MYKEYIQIYLSISPLSFFKFLGVFDLSFSRSRLFPGIFLQGVSHCAFSSNLFHGQIAQIYINQLSAQKTKNVALEKFLEQGTLKPCNF